MNSIKFSGQKTRQIPTPDGSFIEHPFDVVDADIPMLIFLDLLDSAKLYDESTSYVVCNKSHDYSMPVVRKFGHVNIEWPASTILFTRAELKKLHSQFKNLHVDKLMNLLKRSKAKDVDASTRAMFEDIAKHYETCMTFSRSPQRFRVTSPSDRTILTKK